MRLEKIKKIRDLDIRGLAYLIHGMQMTSRRMKKENVDFIFDKFIRCGDDK